MITRLANPSDLEPVLCLVNRLLEELGGKALTVQATSATFSRLVEEEDAGSVVVGEEDGRIVAVCTMSFQDAIRTAGTYAIVQEMYVVPEFRSVGLGARLMEYALSEAHKHGCSVVELGTPANGVRQEQFYQRLGFQAVGLRLRRMLNA